MQRGKIRGIEEFLPLIILIVMRIQPVSCVAWILYLVQHVSAEGGQQISLVSCCNRPLRFLLLGRLLKLSSTSIRTSTHLSFPSLLFRLHVSPRRQLDDFFMLFFSKQFYHLFDSIWPNARISKTPSTIGLASSETRNLLQYFCVSRYSQRQSCARDNINIVHLYCWNISYKAWVYGRCRCWRVFMMNFSLKIFPANSPHICQFKTTSTRCA